MAIFCTDDEAVLQRAFSCGSVMMAGAEAATVVVVVVVVMSGRAMRKPSSCNAHAQGTASGAILWKRSACCHATATAQFLGECKRCGSAKLKSKIFMDIWVHSSPPELAGPQTKHFWYWDFRGWASRFSAVCGI